MFIASNESSPGGAVQVSVITYWIKFIASNKCSPGGSVPVSVITYWTNSIASNESSPGGLCASQCNNILDHVYCQQ